MKTMASFSSFQSVNGNGCLASEGTLASDETLRRTVFDQAVRENNQAAWLMQHGHYTQAAQTLRRPFETLKQLIADGSLPSSSCGASIMQVRDQASTALHLAQQYSECTFSLCSDLSSYESCCTQVISGPLSYPISNGAATPKTATAATVAEQQSCEDEDGIRMYTQPTRLFFLHGSEITTLPSDKAAFFNRASSCAVSVIYNLALVNHLFATRLMRPHQTSDGGVVQYPRSLQLLNKARTLYKLAMDMFIQNDLISNVQAEDAKTLLLIVSNLGAVHVQMGNASEGGAYFSHLLSILMFLVDRGAQPQELTLDFLFHNALYGSRLDQKGGRGLFTNFAPAA